MSGPRSAHIVEEEIDLLLSGAEVPGELRAHLADCADCARAVEASLEGQNALKRIRASTAPGGPECPPPETWWEIAAGIREQNDQLLEHAAGCEQCGGELRAALEPESFLDESLRLESPAERALLSRRMAAKSPASRPRSLLFSKYVPAAIAAMLVLTSAAAFLLFRGPSTSVLIARAYEEQRTVDFRIPGARHSPIRVERGALGEKANQTIPLLEAEGKAAKDLAQKPDDPHLLQQQARIELLNWNYPAALRRLTRALELQPGNRQASYDLSLAYFERAQAENRPLDYGAAVEVLGRLLDKNPDDPVALFNRAIALENLMLYREASADWGHFLKVEPTGGWADEARGRLAEIRKKLDARLQNARPCTAMTARLVVAWSKAGVLQPNLDQWEDGWACLRERAITGWIPALQSPINAEALRIVDSLFRQSTGDTWFGDVLTDSGKPGFSGAAAALSDAVTANRMVDAGRAEAAARVARAEFNRIGNAAGAAQAAVEYDYAIRRAQTPRECRPILDSLENQIRGRAWIWTTLQERLEKYACMSMAGDHGAAKRLALDTVSATQKRAHASLHLRALSYLSESERMTAEYPSVWEHGLEGLRAFWSGREAAVWAYQLYFHLAQAAAATGRPHLALQLHRETLAEIQLAGRPSMEAMEWFDYGRAAMAAGAIPQARSAFSNASGRFRALPGDRGVNAMQADCQVYLAELDNRQGRPAEALARLEKVAPEMSNRDNSFIMQIRFRRTVTDSDKLLGRREQVESDLHALLESTERGLASLKNFGQQQRWARENGDAYRQFVDFLANDQHQPDKALEAWEWFRGAPFRSPGERNGNFPQVRDAFSSLGIGQALVYTALEDRLFIWRIRNGSAVLHTIAIPRSKLANLARRLYLLCSDPNSSISEIDSVARHLSSVLVTPVEAELALDQPLWVDLDEVLSGVPFPVLPLKNGELLGVKCAVSAFPGLEYLKRSLPVRPFTANDPMFAVGISVLPGGAALGLTPLPGAVVEARQAAGRFAGARAWLNGDATLENIQRELPRVGVFHFAGHAQSTTDTAALLVAGRDSIARLDAETVARMDLRQCRLAVISACSAEAPEYFEESRPFGLATALLRAGASTVLATRWNLDSETGLLFMDTFYGRLLAGDTVARAALSAAGQIRKAPRTAHPYYWAAYQLFGRA